VLDRKTVAVYDVDRPVIQIGRTPGLEIVIDNPSVSRQQAEVRREGDGWVVRDIGSSNGTFVNGQRLTADRPLRRGDEISFGKYLLFFERDLAAAGTPAPARPAAAPPAAAAEEPADSTMYLTPEQVERMQKATARKRQAHLLWEAAGLRGMHYLRADPGSMLVGTAADCDLRVPGGPRRHLVVVRDGRGFEVRNLSWWRRMRVQGRVVRQARLRDGDVVRLGRLRLTFMDDLR
jgi:pSer/pThr/pTyr-binding forkhead associated (FHA) protein